MADDNNNEKSIASLYSELIDYNFPINIPLSSYGGDIKSFAQLLYNLYLNDHNINYNKYSIDLNARTINGPSTLGTVSEHRATAILFHMDRYQDGRDLLEANALIQYQTKYVNSEGQEDNFYGVCPISRVGYNNDGISLYEQIVASIEFPPDPNTLEGTDNGDSGTTNAGESGTINDEEPNETDNRESGTISDGEPEGTDNGESETNNEKGRLSGGTSEDQSNFKTKIEQDLLKDVVYFFWVIPYTVTQTATNILYNLRLYHVAEASSTEEGTGQQQNNTGFINSGNGDNRQYYLSYNFQTLTASARVQNTLDFKNLDSYAAAELVEMFGTTEIKDIWNKFMSQIQSWYASTYLGYWMPIETQAQTPEEPSSG